MGSALYLSPTKAKYGCDPLRCHTLQSTKHEQGWKTSAMKKKRINDPSHAFVPYSFSFQVFFNPI